MRRDTYEARYKTGKTGLIINGTITIALILLIVIMLLTGLPGIQLAVVLLVFFLGATFFLLKGYREIILYHNKMEVVTIMDGVIMKVYFADIAHIGFLHSSTTHSG